MVRFPDAAAYLAFSRAWLAAALPHVSRAGTLCIFTNALGRAPLLAACAEQGWALEGAVPLPEPQTSFASYTQSEPGLRTAWANAVQVIQEIRRRKVGE